MNAVPALTTLYNVYLPLKERSDIHMVNGLFFKGVRILIPGCMQGEHAGKAEGHQGVTKCVTIIYMVARDNKTD